MDVDIKEIDEFPGYFITRDGQVYNSRQQALTRSPTAYGDLTVGMVRNGHQHRRSVKVLLARAFVPGETEVFDTPILLDGDREHLEPANIKWRPRWFALMYAKQWDHVDQWWFAGPVVDITTGEEYEHILHAAVDTGSLVRDIRTGMMNRTRVFPEGGQFEFY